MLKKETFSPNWTRMARGGYTYRPAVKKGNMMMISGQASVDPKTGKTLWAGDVVAQTRQAYRNMKDVLEAAGATFADVVKTVEYITPPALNNYKGTANVRREFFGEGDFPAATGVVVNGLVRDDLLIEIEAVAIVD